MKLLLFPMLLASYFLNIQSINHFCLISSPTQTTVIDSLYPILKFDTTALNCDTIEEGVQYKFIYHFTNIGTAPLILANVKSSCGCYVPQWTKEPVEPGKKGTIIGTYNSKGRPGNFTKTITVNSNDPINPTQILRCRGYTKKRQE